MSSRFAKASLKGKWAGRRSDKLNRRPLKKASHRLDRREGRSWPALTTKSYSLQ